MKKNRQTEFVCNQIRVFIIHQLDTIQLNSVNKIDKIYILLSIKKCCFLLCFFRSYHFSWSNLSPKSIESYSLIERSPGKISRKYACIVPWMCGILSIFGCKLELSLRGRNWLACVAAWYPWHEHASAVCCVLCHCTGIFGTLNIVWGAVGIFKECWVRQLQCAWKYYKYSRYFVVAKWSRF